MLKSGVLILGGILIAATILTALWAWTPDRSQRELETKYWNSATHYVEVAGTRLRVRDTGPPTAAAVVLLHGFGSSLETWEPWAQALEGSYRVVRFDLPGSGLSGADRSGKYDDARSLDLMNSLFNQMGIDSAVLIGNSMGGRIAWRFAAAFPARATKLVLISPDGFASPGFEYGKPPQVPAILQLMKYFLPRALMRVNLASAYGDPTRLSDSVVDRYYELLLAPGNRGAMLDRMEQGILEDPIPVLRRVATPTLLLWGEKDRLIPFANSADYLRALPNAKLSSFPGLGHVPHEEAPAESLVPVKNFLAEQLGARGNKELADGHNGVGWSR